MFGEDAADKAGHPVVVGRGGRAVEADGHIGAFVQFFAAQPELAAVLDGDHQVGLGLVQGGDGLAEGGFEGLALGGRGGDGGAQVDERHGFLLFERFQALAVRASRAVRTSAALVSGLTLGMALRMTPSGPMR